MLGRVTNHRVGNNNRDARKKEYNWGINNRLRKITNELTNAETIFNYDEFANLVKARYDFEDIIHRQTDEVGNLYESEDKSDRIYGKGSRLEQSQVNTNELKRGNRKLVTKGAECYHDSEGNLARKIAAPHPNDWTYDSKGNIFSLLKYKLSICYHRRISKSFKISNVLQTLEKSEKRMEHAEFYFGFRAGVSYKGWLFLCRMCRIQHKRI